MSLPDQEVYRDSDFSTMKEDNSNTPENSQVRSAPSINSAHDTLQALGLPSQGSNSASESPLSNSLLSLVTTKQYDEKRYSRGKGWKGLSSLEKSLSVSLGITSTLSVALMIAVIVVGVNRSNDCTVIGEPATTIAPRPTVTPPIDRCNTTINRPPRRGSGVTPTTDPTATADTTIIDGATEASWMPSGGTAECIVSGKNSTICLAPQCFRMAGHVIDSIDFSVDPCRNFYYFACGNWIKNNPIPEYAEKWDQTNILQEKVLREVREILEVDQSVVDSRSLRLAKSFYHSCMHPPDDEVSVAEMRLLIQEMASLENPEVSTAGLSELLGSVRRLLNGNYILSLEINVNDRNTTENAIYLDQPLSGLSSLLKDMDIDIPNVNPDANEGVTGLPLRLHETYHDLAKKLWLLLYPGDILKVEKVLAQIFAFERNLTSIRTNFTNHYDPESPPTFFKLGEIDDAELSSTMISWLSGFVNAVIRGTGNDGADQSDIMEIPNVILRNPEYFRKLELLLNGTDVKVIEQYVKLRILLSYGLHGSLAFKTRFTNFKKAVVKNELASPRWKMCARLTNEYFGWTISEKFLTIFDEITKEQLNQTVKYLKEAFNETLDGVAWIANNETRQYAQNKMEGLRTFLAFPDWWQDEASQNSVNSFVEEYYLDMNFTDASNYFQNYIETVMWMSKKRLAELYEPTLGSDFLTNDDKWPKYDHPTKMLSYYSEALNYLVLPTGVIDRSNSLMDFTFPSLHYGSLGVTLAHQMMQSIDERGRHREVDGSIGQWWDNETIENYRKISQCFKGQFPDLEEQRKPAMIHDSILYNGALSMTYEAYMSQTFEDDFDEVLLPGLQDYSPEQLIFLSFAQSQCSHQNKLLGINRDELLVRNVLLNSVQFARHWNCPLPTEEKTCKLL